MDRFFCLVLFLGIVAGTAHAQAPAKTKIITWTTFPITLSLAGERSDGSGGDPRGVYAITVDFANEADITTKAYLLKYFEDGRQMEEFKDRQLPFVFKRNYKGLVPGDHEIRIDVKDSSGNTLATRSTVVNITR